MRNTIKPPSPRRGGSLPPGWWLAVYFDVARRLRAASRALDESLLGAALGTVIIAAFMVAIPVLLPIIFEVLK